MQLFKNKLQYLLQNTIDDIDFTRYCFFSDVLIFCACHFFWGHHIYDDKRDIFFRFWILTIYMIIAILNFISSHFEFQALHCVIWYIIVTDTTGKSVSSTVSTNVINLLFLIMSPCIKEAKSQYHNLDPDTAP